MLTGLSHTGVRPRLLITGALSRPDILASLDEARKRADLHFVEYEREWGDGLDRKLYHRYGHVSSWEEERNAETLLERIKPQAVVFMQGASLNQMALRIACRRRRLPAVHLEHGWPFPVHDRAAVQSNQAAQALATWRTHAFFMRSLLEAPIPLGRYAWEIRQKRVSAEFLRRWAWLRGFDTYISYSEACFSAHRDLDRVPPHVAERTIFVGIPQFDGFRHNPEPIDDDAIILIDHQHANTRVFGWTMDNRRAFVRDLQRLVCDLGLRLYVKLHPGDKSGVWNSCADNGDVQIIDQTELEDLANRVGTVIGGFSTIQIPLAALPNIAMIALEIHPDGGPWYPSRAFVEAGVARAVRSLPELREALAERQRLRRAQQLHAAAFERKFMFSLDGQATLRLADALEDVAARKVLG